MGKFKYLFDPRAIAVIGASPEAHRPGAQTIRALQDNRFDGRVYPVNPKYPELAGLPCYRSIADVPKPCDIAVIALPATLVPETIAACGAQGVRFAVVLGGGFREAGEAGQRLESQMLSAAREHDVRIVGPNCLGLVNVHARAYAAFGSLARPPVLSPGPVSAVIQSGGFGNSLVVRCGLAGIGFRLVVASGSESDLGTPELIEAMVDDPQTRLILIYMEGVRDGPRFVAAARRALAEGKPIVVWKAGNTRQGIKAAASHTANMTGSYDIYRAVFRQCGVVEVHDMEEAIACVQSLLVYSDRPAGDEVAIMGGSGGSAVVFSDAADRYGLRLSRLAPQTSAVLKRVLPGTASLDNPIDYAAGFITNANAARFRDAVDAVLDDPGVSQLGVMLATTTGEAAANGGKVLAEAVARHAKPVFVFLSVPRETTAGGQDALERAGIPVFPTPTRVALAMKVLSEYEKARSELHRLAAGRMADSPPPATQFPSYSGALSEHESKNFLAAWGVRVTADRLIPAAPLEATDASGWTFPVALKVVSRDIAHKSDIGGVQLDIANADELVNAVSEMLERVRARAPEAALDGLLVSEMIGDALETIVGVVNDEVFGPVVALGMGGILAETLQDITYRLAPFDLKTAHQMVGELRACAMFSGVRGNAAADIDALAATLVTVSNMSWHLRNRIAEVEINPLLVRSTGHGVVAADALMRFR
ncbi:MAG: acetate--CoA ligase family protein [Proteobacteria bacterium]|nr:acetate--CoA ligase family protein [Burkholderiales bacterium]